MAAKVEAGGSKKARVAAVIAAAVILIAIAVIIGINMFGSQRTPKSTLEGYFNALYCETMIKHMTPYLVDDIQQICYDDFTFYGQSVGILKAYQEEKAEIVGPDFTLSVRIDNEETGSSAALSSAAKSYGASALMDVSFTVTFEGEQGTADFTGIARLVKVSGKWYLTEYNLPLERVE